MVMELWVLSIILAEQWNNIRAGMLGKGNGFLEVHKYTKESQETENIISIHRKQYVWKNRIWSCVNFKILD